MKLIITLMYFMTSMVLFSQVGIGTVNPNSTAALDLVSNSKGFLFPRMSANQKEQIQDPAEGLVLYCNNCCDGGAIIFNNGSAWRSLTESTCQNSDPDLDGVENSNDLDDDNDGILDTEELQIVRNPDFENGSSSQWNLSGSVGAFSHAGSSGGGILGFSGGDNPTDGVATQSYTFSGTVSGTLSYGLATNGVGSSIARVEVFINNVSQGVRDATTNLSSGSETVNVSFQNLSSPMEIRFVDRTANTISRDLIISFVKIFTNALDTDGDGIDDRQDNDSDGDGCPDALEGTGSIAQNQLYSTGSIISSVNNNGVPLIISSGQNNGNSKLSNIDTACN